MTHWWLHTDSSSGKLQDSVTVKTGGRGVEEVGGTKDRKRKLKNEGGKIKENRRAEN